LFLCGICFHIGVVLIDETKVPSTALIINRSKISRVFFQQKTQKKFHAKKSRKITENEMIPVISETF
jgi:hypothetical protein